MIGDSDWYVGIDWATKAHEVCTVDPSGKIVDRRSVPHTGDGLAELANRLGRLSEGRSERVAVAIEVPHGAVVETLLERGFTVFSLNPKQLDRFRDRFSPAGAKDDRRDAYVLADSARTDLQCFRRLQVQPADVIRLRELVRTEEELKEEHRRNSNRLRALLHRYFPQILDLAPAADEPWIWELLSAAPTPDKGRGLREATIAQLLSRNRIRRVTARQVRDILHATPLQVAPGTAEAASEHVVGLLPRLELTSRQLEQVQLKIGALLESVSSPDDIEAADEDHRRSEHRDVEILLSSPGIGRIVAATMLAQASTGLGDRDYHALRAQAGLAPVTRSSGKSRRVVMRRACDKRLRNAFYHMARVATIYDPAARAHYRELRKRGHSHGRALRAVADRLLRILCAMLRDHTLYDPGRLHDPRSLAQATA